MSRDFSVLMLASSVEIGGLERLLEDLLSEPPAGVRTGLLVLRDSGNFGRRLLAGGLGERVEVLPLDRPTPSALRGLGRRIRSFRPTLLHAFGLRAELLSRLVRAPGAVRLGTAAAPFLPHARLRGLTAALPWRAPVAYWADCEARGREAARTHGLPEDRIRVVYPGIRPPRRPDPQTIAALRRRAGAVDGGPLLVAVGNLRHVKGHDLALDALPTVRQRYPRARLAVVGRDLEDGSLRRAARERGVEDLLYLAGYSDDPTPWLAAADVVLQPSRSEGLPRVPLEAMALGRPVVAARIGGIPEAIDDGCGWLVTPEDAGALAAGVLEVLDHPAEARRRGSAAARRAQEHFTSARMLADFGDLWRAHALATRNIDLSTPEPREWVAEPAISRPWSPR